MSLLLITVFVLCSLQYRIWERAADEERERTRLAQEQAAEEEEKKSGLIKKVGALQFLLRIAETLCRSQAFCFLQRLCCSSFTCVLL